MSQKSKAIPASIIIVAASLHCWLCEWRESPYYSPSQKIIGLGPTNLYTEDDVNPHVAFIFGVLAPILLAGIGIRLWPRKGKVPPVTAAAIVFLAMFLPAHSASSVATPSGNGDVNGDGAIDLSDAVYTLLYLFRDGPAPVALADSPSLLARVEALEARPALTEEQAQILSFMKLGGWEVDEENNAPGAWTVIFNGVNVQIVNGQREDPAPVCCDGPATTPNGLGNLVIGYRDYGCEFGDHCQTIPINRTASHSLIMGGEGNFKDNDIICARTIVSWCF